MFIMLACQKHHMQKTIYSLFKDILIKSIKNCLINPKNDHIIFLDFASKQTFLLQETIICVLIFFVTESFLKCQGCFEQAIAILLLVLIFNIYYCFSKTYHRSMVFLFIHLICISVMTSDVERIFICLLTVHIQFLMENQFKSFLYLKIRLIFLSLLS